MLAFSMTASRNKVLITFQCDEYECIVTVFKTPCSRRDARKNRMAPKPARQQERQGSRVVLCLVLFFSYFTFFYACPIIMSLPFMIGSSTVNNKVVCKYDERSRRFQLHSRINGEELVPGSISFCLLSDVLTTDPVGLLSLLAFILHHHNHTSSYAGREAAAQHPEEPYLLMQCFAFSCDSQALFAVRDGIGVGGCLDSSQALVGSATAKRTRHGP